MLPDGIGKTRRYRFRRTLLTWAKLNQRDYPWRRSGTSVYHLLVAELLLKRTTATAAARAYGPFIAKFPTVNLLALASEDEIAQLLKPIGLSRQRSRAIRTLATALVEHYDGVPTTLKELCALPGIGDYAARAILSFGYGVPVAVVDGNVQRVIARVFQGDLGPGTPRGEFQSIADALLPQRRHRDYNFALLDLGSLICRPAKPKCGQCPFQRQCNYVLEPIPTGVNASLKAARQEQGLSLASLATKAGVSKLTIINIEAGRTVPKAETLAKISRAIGKEVSYIDISAATLNVP